MVFPVEVTLPGGVEVEGRWYRSAWLAPVTGYEEEFLLGVGRFLSAAARATQLISRCLCRLGPVEPVGVEMVRRLSVGDREAILLNLRRFTLGERVSCILVCPCCAKKMDQELSIGELLQLPSVGNGTLHETRISDGVHDFKVLFRIPNGEDQESVAEMASQSLTEAAETILQRCISSVTSGGEELSATPEVVLRELPQRMAELDPQAELLLSLVCPECRAGFVLPFDITDYFCRELTAYQREFYREVHLLSFYYHWDEDSVLKLDRRKRQIYTELVGDEIAGSWRR